MTTNEDALRVQLDGVKVAVDQLHEADALADLIVGRLREDGAPVALVRRAEELQAEILRWGAESG